MASDLRPEEIKQMLDAALGMPPNAMRIISAAQMQTDYFTALPGQEKNAAPEEVNGRSVVQERSFVLRFQDQNQVSTMQQWLAASGIQISVFQKAGPSGSPAYDIVIKGSQEKDFALPTLQKFTESKMGIWERIKRALGFSKPPPPDIPKLQEVITNSLKVHGGTPLLPTPAPVSAASRVMPVPGYTPAPEQVYVAPPPQPTPQQYTAPPQQYAPVPQYGSVQPQQSYAPQYPAQVAQQAYQPQSMFEVGRDLLSQGMAVRQAVHQEVRRELWQGIQQVMSGAIPFSSQPAQQQQGGYYPGSPPPPPQGYYSQPVYHQSMQGYPMQYPQAPAMQVPSNAESAITRLLATASGIAPQAIVQHQVVQQPDRFAPQAPARQSVPGSPQSAPGVTAQQTTQPEQKGPEYSSPSMRR